MKNLVFNLLKLIGIMYISISLKNLLQIFFGTIIKFDGVTKPYRLININNRSNLEAKINHLKLIFLYDYILFAFIFYLWIFVILLFLIKKFGNKLWIQISYSLSIYLLAITYYDPFHYNILFILIAIFLGYANWWLFKKWINFD